MNPLSMVNSASSAEEVSQLKAQIAALEQLLEVHERTTIEQSEKLEEQSYLTQTITDNATAALFMMDVHGHATFMNPAAEAITGYTLDEIRGMPLHDAIHHTHPDGTPYPMSECPIDRALPENNEMRAHEDIFVRKDGTFFPVSVAARPILRHGKPRGTVVEVRDVTKTKRAEVERERLIRALDVERARLADLFQGAPAFIAVLRGPDHVFEIANPPYLQLVGDRNVLGRAVAEALPEVVEQGFVALLDQVYTSGEPFVGNELRVFLQRTSDDTPQERFVNFVYQPVRDADGSVGGIFVHGVDVTEQVRVRQEVERKAAELARTARALEATNRELDQFAYVASHDLKAPLRGIANLSQWIEEDIADALSDENREQMNLLRGRVHRMEGLIEGILQYSRAGRMGGKPELLDTGTLVREVTELLDPPDHFTVRIAEDMPTLETERLPLQQVFMNLIGNAIKYADRPDARIEIAARDVGDYWDFGVADNGPGIAPEYHDKIFAIFQRLEARDQVEGTGIGLSLVKKIVDGRRGRVWVESQEGLGTTFRFTWLKVPERVF